MKRIMLDKWAAHIDDRRTIVAFFEWCEDKGHSSTELAYLNIEKLLDEYHGIDQKQLEKERRALLKQALADAERVRV